MLNETFSVSFKHRDDIRTYFPNFHESLIDNSEKEVKITAVVFNYDF